MTGIEKLDKLIKENENYIRFAEESIEKAPDNGDTAVIAIVEVLTFSKELIENNMELAKRLRDNLKNK